MIWARGHGGVTARDVVAEAASRRGLVNAHTYHRKSSPPPFVGSLPEPTNSPTCGSARMDEFRAYPSRTGLTHVSQ